MALSPSWILVLHSPGLIARYNSYNLTPEQRVTDLELEFRFEVLHIRDLGPVTHVLEHLVGLVESMLCGEGFQPLGINILLNEIVKIRECINIYK